VKNAWFSISIRRWFFISIVLLGAGCNDNREARCKDFDEKYAQLVRKYRGANIHDADAALEELDMLLRKDGQLTYTPIGLQHERGLVLARRSTIHSRLGDESGARKFMEQALPLLGTRESNTNVTPENVVATINKLEEKSPPKWRQQPTPQ